MPQSSASTNKPELKVGPFAGGIAVNVWRNTVQTDQGPRTIRSITISPRRYRDTESGEWRDSYSFRPIDLTALILAMEKAREYILTAESAQQSEESVDDGRQENPF